MLSSHLCLVFELVSFPQVSPLESCQHRSSPHPCYMSCPSFRFGGFFECVVTWFMFNDEELLAPRPTHKLEDHPLSVVRDCLFSISQAVRPSATWGRAMPWWQRPTYHGLPNTSHKYYRLRQTKSLIKNNQVVINLERWLKTNSVLHWYTQLHAHRHLYIIRYMQCTAGSIPVALLWHPTFTSCFMQ